MLSYLELVELPNGDIVLQRSEEGAEPLVTIRFSAESRDYMGGSCLEVARAMVQAGIDVAADQEGDAISEEADEADDEIRPADDSTTNKTLH